MTLKERIETSEKGTPRWIVFVFDIFLSTVSITFAFLLRYNFSFAELSDASMLYAILLVVGIRAISFSVSKLYAGIIRHTTLHDTERILVVLSLGTVLIALINFAVPLFTELSGYKIPLTVLAIDLLLISVLFFSTRVIAKGLFWRLVAPRRKTQYVVIYGAGQHGAAVKHTYETVYDRNSEVLAFLDNNNRAVGKRLDGVDVYHYSKFEELLNNHEISTFLIAEPDIDPKLKRSLLETALKYDVKALTVPKASDWINNSVQPNQIRQVKIEDLLERRPIKLDETNISTNVKGKRVLITGAAGSIGSEIVRQVTRYNPGVLILIDQAESPLYDIELQIREEFNYNNLMVHIGDITHIDRMERIFFEEQPEIVYHAAAYKHVPMMENHPAEAILNNVKGTKVIADLATKYQCEKFVMVSTDKAVNPTNVMGASKRIAEIYCQSLNDKSNTQYITTRFGNVLGSNGSVIPRFRKQIEMGGPLTITHPEITRFFMTIPEACQLVLEAGAMGTGGEIFIFDMGESVKIDDLARKMVKLAGLIPGKDIQFNYTGLRPGEKLYEELLNSKENTLPTYHSRIMIAKVRKYELKEVKSDLIELFQYAKEDSTTELVFKMKQMIPEYVSKNSRYEKIDTKVSTTA